MEELSDKVGPGTAGIAQRVYKISMEEKSIEESLEGEMYVLRFNKIMSCGHNQF